MYLDVESTDMAYKLFLSHGREDKWILKQFLKRRLISTGASVFIDDDAINIGDDFREIILNNLRLCNEFLLLLTPSSHLRPWVWAETGASLIRKKRIAVIKYLPPGFDLEKSGIRSLFSKIQFTEFDDIENYLKQLKVRVGEYNG